MDENMKSPHHTFGKILNKNCKGRNLAEATPELLHVHSKTLQEPYRKASRQPYTEALLFHQGGMSNLQHIQ